MCFQSAWIEQKRGKKTVKYCVINQCRILTQNEYFPHKRSVSKAFQMRVWRYKHPSTKCVQFNLLLYRLHINKEVITCIINAAGFGWAISFKAGLAAFKRCPVVEFLSMLSEVLARAVNTRVCWGASGPGDHRTEWTALGTELGRGFNRRALWGYVLLTLTLLTEALHLRDKEKC